MPSRTINVVGRESGQCDMIEIPKGKKTNLLPLPSDVKFVSSSILLIGLKATMVDEILYVLT